MMVMDFYILKRGASPQCHKFDPLIYFHAQAEYGSEIGEDSHNTTFKPDLIQIFQKPAHTTRFLGKYLQNLSLCHLTQSAFQIPTIVVSETDCKLY